MPMLLADWDINHDTGHLVSNLTDGGKDSGTQFLILGVVLLVVWFLLTAMFAYYFVQFKKVKSGTKLYGRAMLITNLVLTVVTGLFACLVLAFWGNAKQVFGVENGLKAYHTEIAMTVLGFVSLAATIFIMWFFLPYFGITFDGKRILFMGEDIPYQSITKIVSDKATGATYVNYTRGKRAHKRLRFSASSAFGLFIKKNASLTGHAVVEDDEKSYYESLMNSDKAAEAAFNKEVDEKVKNKSARSTSTSKAKTTKAAPKKSTAKSSNSKSKSKNK